MMRMMMMKRSSVSLALLVAALAVAATRFAEAAICDSNPCRNGATCQPDDKGYNWGYKCACAPGFVGAQCQWDGESCNGNTTTPCRNGGICVETQDGRFCDCPGRTANSMTYGGVYCEKAVPCNSCPVGTVYCQPADFFPKARMCLDSNRVEIPGSS